ncbi:MAG: ComEC/Rec2 family competence protein [Patescibacteria group bacterium]|nr:ComEC/Rec2 family competence protein [Patescibacteria group bacterium]
METEDFSYKNYLNRFGIQNICFFPKNGELISHQDDWFTPFEQYKNSFNQRLREIFIKPYSDFASGILLGSRSGLSDYWTEVLKNTGLTHVIAISGYNITLIINILIALLFFLRRPWRYVAIFPVLIIFMLITGADAPVVRATIMGIIASIAVQLGRPNSLLIALLWSALFMVLFNPLVLYYDIGYQLSVAATLGIILLYPKFEQWWDINKERDLFKEVAALTISAQLAVTPLLLYHFHSFSFISLGANILLTWLIPFAMLLAFLAVFTSNIPII